MVLHPDWLNPDPDLHAAILLYPEQDRDPGRCLIRIHPDPDRKALWCKVKCFDQNRPMYLLIPLQRNSRSRRILRPKREFLKHEISSYFLFWGQFWPAWIRIQNTGYQKRFGYIKEHQKRFALHKLGSIQLAYKGDTIGTQRRLICNDDILSCSLGVALT